MSRGRRSDAGGGVEAWLLLAVLAVVYVPVMVHLPLRTTGDEKTYIAQAVEMAHNGNWFKQLLFGVPDYYKGPLFPVLLRIGMIVFGPTAPLALVYMNLIGYVAAALAMLRLVRSRLPDDLGAALLAAAVVVLSCGGYAHALASQMEALLVAAYAIFLMLLGTALPDAAGRRARAGLWVVAGVAGWLKSPLHAALLGTSALAYWTWSGELKRYLRVPAEWGSVLLGIAVGIAGYAPVLILDRAAFVDTYLLRETFSRGGNHVGVDEALMPFLTAHLLPWLPLLLVAVWVLFRRRRNAPVTAYAALLAQSLAVIVPTVGFFVWHPSRNGIYVLPVLPAVAVVIAVGWHKAAYFGWRRPLTAALATSAALVVITSAAVMALVWRFAPWPWWWGQGTTLILAAGLSVAILAFAGALWVEAPHRRVRWSVVAMASFFVAVGQVLVALAGHETADVLTATLPGGDAPWIRLNLTEHLWSETGILNFMTGHAVLGVQNPDKLRQSLTVGQVYLVPDDEQLKALRDATAAHGKMSLEVLPWRRWRTHGEGPDGVPLWLTAWRMQSLAPLERNEYVAVAVASPSVATRATP